MTLGNTEFARDKKCKTQRSYTHGESGTLMFHKYVEDLCFLFNLRGSTFLEHPVEQIMYPINSF